MNRISPEYAGSPTRDRILNALRVHGPQARVDLSAIVEMSPATVSGVTGELVRAGAMREVLERDPSESGRGRGRPKVTIELVPQTAHVVAVKLSINEVQVALGDFTGGTALTETRAVDTRSLSAEGLVEVLGEAIARCRDKMAPGYGPCLGIGLAIQGLVRDSDMIAWSPALSVRDVDIVRPLVERFGLPVYAANDANCIALALRNRPEFQSVDNMAVLMLGTGVGMGLIVGGKVYDGRTGAAAEFGHTKYQMDGPFCHCGRRGCIESFVGDYALYRDARAMLDLPNTDALHPSEEQMQVLCDLASRGDPVALGLFEQAGRALGFGLTNLIALISPSLILVSGSGVRAYEYLEPSMRGSLRDGLVETLLANTHIRPYPWNEDLTLRGITALVLGSVPYQPN
ncbi:MAG TPA: ROK family protein [Candidatus Binatia bacterium]|nr:ROK family protein [Candidatus Binatia bacterium]